MGGGGRLISGIPPPMQRQRYSKPPIFCDFSYFDVNYHPTKFENDRKNYWGSTVPPKKSYISIWIFWEIFAKNSKRVLTTLKPSVILYLDSFYTKRLLWMTKTRIFFCFLKDIVFSFMIKVQYKSYLNLKLQKVWV